VASSELEKRAADAVRMAKKAGADGVFAGASRSRNVSYKYRDGELEEVKDSTSRSISLRLFVDGRYSAHATTDLRPERVEKFIAEAVALTRALQPDKYRTLADPSLYEGRPEDDLDLIDADLAKLDREQRLAWCEEMNARVHGQKPVISTTSSVGDGHVVSAAASSNGFTGNYEATSVGISTSCTLQDADDKRPEDWMGAWGRHLDALPDPKEVADRALELARARLGTAKGPTERTTMIVDNRASGSMIRRLIGPASGGSVQQGRSFWKGKLGEKMVAATLTLTDDPTIPRGLGSRPFDGEGIAARRLPVIEQGVFANLYLDTYYANKLDMKPTTGGSSNLIVELGTRGRDELCAAAGKGIYVTSWLGGNMDSTTGDFSFGARGHRIENGKLGAPVGEMNVTGNIVELFAKLTEVGNDPWLYSSLLAPTLAFGDVQFSGV
jgi:PmbA protein